MTQIANYVFGALTAALATVLATMYIVGGETQVQERVGTVTAITFLLFLFTVPLPNDKR